MAKSLYVVESVHAYISKEWREAYLKKPYSNGPTDLDCMLTFWTADEDDYNCRVFNRVGIFTTMEEAQEKAQALVPVYTIKHDNGDLELLAYEIDVYPEDEYGNPDWGEPDPGGYVTEPLEADEDIGE